MPRADAIKHKTAKPLTESDNIKQRWVENYLKLYE